MRRRPSFYWWDDAVEVARTLAGQTGVRHRVRKVAGDEFHPWRVEPAVVRLVEATC